MPDSSHPPQRFTAGRNDTPTYHGRPPDPGGAWPSVGRYRRALRRARAVRRAALVMLWTLFAILVQAILIWLPGRGKVVFARWYWAVFARLLGMHVRVIGAPIRRSGTRRTVFVSNHSSWMDVPVLGGRLESCFVSKDDVAKWPLIGTVARLGRTAFITRSRSSTGRGRTELQERLEQGDDLILFPEGTTSDGSRVLPFRSSFFAVAEGPDAPLIQPVSVVYDRLAGLPTGRTSRPLFAYYGDMHIASHFWRLAQKVGLRATVLIHPPLDPAHFPDRKALAAAVWSSVAAGADLLRQNRPVRPADDATQAASPIGDGKAAAA